MNMSDVYIKRQQLKLDTDAYRRAAMLTTGDELTVSNFANVQQVGGDGAFVECQIWVPRQVIELLRDPSAGFTRINETFSRKLEDATPDELRRVLARMLDDRPVGTEQDQ